MSKKTRFINANRRGFMQKSAVIGGAAVTAATVTGVQAETVTEEKKLAPTSAGYQLTDRVREYYQKARF